MKRSWRGVILMSLVLFCNIVFTQYTINHYYHEKYKLVLLFAALNIAVFPVAWRIYKKEARSHERK
jgi:uncharacterized membrane protein